MIRRGYRWLTRILPWGVFTAPFVLGIIFWGGFNTAMDLTNREAFCISCHEMRDNVYKEYRKTIHYTNRTGVRAICPDCHVPRDWIHMVPRKIRATNELFHWLIGSINTREKFIAKRLQLANYVWSGMRDTDSRECRNCHAFNYMDLAKQNSLSGIKHKQARQKGQTCIDCHMGIAHQIAKNFDADGKLHEMFRKTRRDCSDCHKGMTRAPD